MGRRPLAGRPARPGPPSDGGGPDACGPTGGHGAADDPGDAEQVARSICLHALTGSAKSRRQLAELLDRRGVPDAVAQRVLDRLGEVGLVDDAAFARAWVSSRQSGRGLARRALRAELRAKGIDGEVAEDAVAQVDDDEEWAAARRLVARRLPTVSRVDRGTAERRLVGMLARKGYGGGLAAWVVREALDGSTVHGGREEEPGPDDAGDDDGPAGWRR